MAGVKARGAPSVACPLGGTPIHWIAVFSRLALSAPPDGALLGAPAGLSTARRSLTPASLDKDVLDALGRDLL